MTLFILDPKTRLVELNQEWISTIKEFKVIIERNKKDHNTTMKEFTFLYHFCDYRSKFLNYPEDQKYKECLRNAQMPEDYNLETDLDMFHAVIRYKALHKSPSLVALVEVREGLHTSIKFVKKLREIIDQQITELDLQKLQIFDETKKKGAKSPLEILDAAVSSLLKRGKDLPTTIQNLKELEEKVKAEMTEETALRGNANKGEREDTNSQPIKVGERNIFDN